MHPVLRNFMDAAGRSFLMEAVKLVERASAFADGVRLLNGLGHIGFGEYHGLAELLSGCKLRGNRG